MGFIQSEVHGCFFYKSSVNYVLCTDDSIIVGPNKKEINNIIDSIKQSGLSLTIEGSLQDFLGVHMERWKNGSMKLNQVNFERQICRELSFDERTKP